ncbi:hypothetical protein SETIT_3G265300v2, partial [Setaria italica]
MGCAASRLEDEEAVKMCRDRRDFIKQALDQRNRFASSHIAYIESLKRVSMALQRFVAVDDHHELIFDTFISPVKQQKPEMLSLPYGSYEKRTIHVSKYLRSGPNPSVSVEEHPRPVETVPSYPPPSPQEPVGNSYRASYDRPSYPPPSPQEQESSPWDFFWNPFSSYDNVVTDDELAWLQRVREEEGIPELEEEDDECQDHVPMHRKEEKEEHDDEDDEEEDDEEDDEEECEHSDECIASNEGACSVNFEVNTKQETKGFESKGVQCAEAPQPRKTVELEIKAHKKELMRNKVANAEETPGFTVYLNRRPASLVEAMKDIDCHFLGICDAAREVSVMLEASRAHSIDDLFDNETSSCHSEESCSTMSGSHQSTLDRLYTWEKKLYKEVKAGERLRIEYEKTLTQLRNQDEKGEEPSSVNRTRAALRSLHTRLKVSIHTVQSISRRIKVLRDEELHPQLMELIHGLSRMWRTMAERHKAQKRHPSMIIRVSSTYCRIGKSELYVRGIGSVRWPWSLESFTMVCNKSAPRTKRRGERGSPYRTPLLHANLFLGTPFKRTEEREALETWLSAQRAYARALAAWARRCLGVTGGARPTLSAAVLPPAFLVCMEWGHAMDADTEARVMDGLDFVAGVGSVCSGAATGMEGMAGRVLCAGMAAVTGAMAEFATASADIYDAAVARGRRGTIAQ